MGKNVERLFSGLFECGECGIHYRVTDADEAALFCSECGADLEPLENEADEEDAEVEADDSTDEEGPELKVQHR